ncbi:Retrovirus-related Pol polyprotein from type-2 retrotransposable element R2DM [Labeo rohita]|uniref:Retrovirus-related Pol polyprotein from type-2 retrotransposable element R2DM n=1 Tax=Labeo rohita TaxID=84645 RepID=A0ABQ8MXS0_LABRO|nr:Retrovirus-related Pol polyprotein from type-2 retrotransposable element R2DM [Labeo rohita]
MAIIGSGNNGRVYHLPSSLYHGNGSRIIRASKWVVGGERLQSGQCLSPIRAYMDDMTTLTSTIACTKRLLEKLHANITWAHMKLKPSKSRSISIVRGKLIDQKFHIDETPIPMVLEMPVKSLGRWYNASLNDSDQTDQLREETIKGLESINNTLLPGKLKLWCLQFGLLPHLMWPLTVYMLPITKIEKLERTVSSYIKKWLGLPRVLVISACMGKVPWDYQSLASLKNTNALK